MSIKLLAGRYELLEKIGDGGMAIVYKARCRLLNRFVAIKILKPEFVSDPRILDNFRRESQSAASLNHPNIVNIYDVGREGNVHYIVMELIEGKTLSDLIEEEGPMEFHKAIEITRQIASGLSFAHKNNIIHRDIKPQNILMTADGTAKIADFGIAKAANEISLKDEDGEEMIMGSVHYFSPEQARGGYVDSKSDIYSLGIVMYEMLTGKVPFDAPTAVQVAVKHMNEEITPPSEIVKGIPSRLEQVVLKCTQKVSVNRYNDVDEIIKDLDDILRLSRIVGSAAIDPENVEVDYIKKETETDSDFNEKPEKKNNKTKKNGKNKKKKIIIISAAVAAAVIAAICIFIFASPSEVEVPDLTGKTYEQAEEILKEAGLEIEEGNEVYSDKYEEGQIVSQSPEADMKVKKGKAVKVNISKGSGKETVPSLIGMTTSEARTAIESSGFNVGTIDYEESDYPEGTVISQDPQSGSQIKKGQTINIVVAKEKEIETSKVPGLLGKDVEDAEAAIIGAGLSVGSITYGYSEDYPKGQVISQQYKSGYELEHGTSVDIMVSKGPDTSKQSDYEEDFTDENTDDEPVEVE